MTIRFWRVPGGYQIVMEPCCPPGHGCNAPGGGEPCALALCRAAAQEEDDAALALARWSALEAAQDEHCGDGERRFRRRAFERARDKALITLAMTPGRRPRRSRRHPRRPLAA